MAFTANGAALALGTLQNKYLGLLTDSGEISGKGYSRLQFSTSNTAISGNTLKNTAALYFPEPTENWGTVTKFGIFSALSNGNLLYEGELKDQETSTTGVTITTDNIFLIRANQLNITLDA